MAYIGKTPVIGNFVKLDSITVVNGQAAYTMQNGGVNFTSYDNVNQFLVSLNGVLQAPTDSFTVSGSTLTFASNLSTGDVIDFVLVLGNSLDIGTPSDNTVTAAKIGANAVTNAKLNNDIISGATELATEPADTDEFLVSDAGTIKRIDYSLIKGGGITEVDMWEMSNQTYAHDDWIDTGWSRFTSLTGAPHGTGLTESSGIFTFPSTGVYEILFQTYFWNPSTTRAYVGVDVRGSTDGFASNYTRLGLSYTNTSTADDHSVFTISCIYDVTNTSNNKIRFRCQAAGSLGFYRTRLITKKLMET